MHNWLRSDLYLWELFFIFKFSKSESLFNSQKQNKRQSDWRLSGVNLFWTWPDYNSLMRHYCSQAILIFASNEFYLLMNRTYFYDEVPEHLWKRVDTLTLVLKLAALPQMKQSLYINRRYLYFTRTLLTVSYISSAYQYAATTASYTSVAIRNLWL